MSAAQGSSFVANVYCLAIPFRFAGKLNYGHAMVCHIRIPRRKSCSSSYVTTKCHHNLAIEFAFWILLDTSYGNVYGVTERKVCLRPACSLVYSQRWNREFASDHVFNELNYQTPIGRILLRGSLLLPVWRYEKVDPNSKFTLFACILPCWRLLLSSLAKSYAA